MTSKQKKLFKYLKNRIEVGGVCPSNVEMMTHMGIRSKSSISGMLRSLENEGIIRIIPGKARNIQLSSSRSHTCIFAMRGIIDPVGFVERARYAGVIQ